MEKTTAESSNRQAVTLLLSPTGRDAELASGMLCRAGLPCMVCQTAGDLMVRLRRGEGPAVIAAEAIGPKQTAALQDILAAQPPWSDLPLIIVAGKAALPRHLATLVSRQNTTLLHRPLEMDTFVTTVRSARQNRLRQYQVRDLIRNLEVRAGQLQELASELTLAEQRERSRIAQILHDNLQQVLVGAKFGLNSFPGPVTDDQVAAVEYVEGLIDEAIRESRSLTSELVPPVLREYGLADGLAWLAEWMKEKHGLDVALTADRKADSAREDVRVLVFQSVRELLFNVVKHAGVREANVELTADGPNQLRVTVEDAGRGFDPDEVLQPCDNTRSGFGLFTIRERLKLMGGRFAIEGAVGKGSRFDIIAPTRLDADAPLETRSDVPVSGDHVAAPTTTESPKRTRGGSVRVLVVDDNTVVRQALSSILSAEPDLEVVGEACDGLEALDMAKSKKPDLVLMDVSMPKMDGVEACRRLGREMPQVIVIALSIHEDSHRVKAMKQAGADAYLVKSGKANEVLTAIRNLCEPSPADRSTRAV